MINQLAVKCRKRGIPICVDPEGGEAEGAYGEKPERQKGKLQVQKRKTMLLHESPAFLQYLLRGKVRIIQQKIQRRIEGKIQIQTGDEAKSHQRPEQDIALRTPKIDNLGRQQEDGLQSSKNSGDSDNRVRVFEKAKEQIGGLRLLSVLQLHMDADHSIPEDPGKNTDQNAHEFCQEDGGSSGGRECSLKKKLQEQQDKEKGSTAARSNSEMPENGISSLGLAVCAEHMQGASFPSA